MVKVATVCVRQSRRQMAGADYFRLTRIVLRCDVANLRTLIGAGVLDNKQFGHTDIADVLAKQASVKRQVGGVLMKAYTAWYLCRFALRPHVLPARRTFTLRNRGIERCQDVAVKPL